jgi:hypothetical protein
MAKDMKSSIAGDQVMFSNISKSKDGYNSARLVAKVNEKEYMSISYEWEGTNVPEFAMNLMSFMQANELEVGSVTPSYTDEYDEDAAKKGKNPFMKKDDEEDMEDEDKKKKSKKEKSGEGSQVICKNCKKTKDKCDCGNWQAVPYKTKDQKENKTK